MGETRFCGPLFLVGRPRSGTKLLRTLLNEHPEISIPESETHFIVPLLKRFGADPALQRDARFNAFYAQLAGSNFFRKMADTGKSLEKAHLRTANLGDWSSIFETILKFYGPKGADHAAIWGDKTPSYLTHIALLKSALPSAKFLHIVRDPRDYCLSMLSVWGRNPLLSAEKWRKDIQRARQVGQQLDNDYAEVHFEALLSAPEATLREVCDFTGITFLPEMLHMSVSSENLGDATGQRRIVTGNQRKYLSRMPQNLVQRIEEIVYPVALELDYAPDFATRFRALHPAEALLLKIKDGMAWSKFHFNEKGIRQGLAYLYRSL